MRVLNLFQLECRIDFYSGNTMGDKSIVDQEENENVGPTKRRNSRFPPPKPPRKNRKAERMASCSSYLDMSEGYLSSDSNASSCGRITLDNGATEMATSNQDGPGLCDGGNVDEEFEEHPSVQAIILSFNQEAANDCKYLTASGSSDGTSTAIRKPERFQRRESRSDVTLSPADKHQSSRNFLFTRVRKVAPQVPVKPFKCDQGRAVQSNSCLEQENNSQMQVNIVIPVQHKNNDDSDSVQQDNDSLPKEVVIHKTTVEISTFVNGQGDATVDDGMHLGPVSFNEKTAEEVVRCQDVESSQVCCFPGTRDINCSCVGLDLSAKTIPYSGYFVKERNDDSMNVEKRFYMIPSFTTEDVEFRQKHEIDEEQDEFKSPPTTAERTGILKRKKDLESSRFSTRERARNRRSRSVGAPGFQLKDFSLPKERPQVPAKPKGRKKQISKLLSDPTSSLPGNTPAVPDQMTEGEVQISEGSSSDIHEPNETGNIQILNEMRNVEDCQSQVIENSVSEVHKQFESFHAELNIDCSRKEIHNSSEQPVGKECQVLSEDSIQVRCVPIVLGEGANSPAGKTGNEPREFSCDIDAGQENLHQNNTNKDLADEENIYDTPGFPRNVSVAGEEPIYDTPSIPRKVYNIQVEWYCGSTQNSLDENVLNQPPNILTQNCLQLGSEEQIEFRRTFDVTLPRKSSFSEVLDLATESSESIASSQVKLDELDDSLSDSRTQLNVTDESSSHMADQERPFDHSAAETGLAPRADVQSCGNNFRSQDSGDTEMREKKKLNFPEVDCSTVLRKTFLPLANEGNHGSLSNEIFHYLAGGADIRAAGSLDSGVGLTPPFGKMAVPTQRMSYNVQSHADVLMAAVSSVGKEMEDICMQLPCSSISRTKLECKTDPRKTRRNHKASRTESLRALKEFNGITRRWISSEQNDSDVDDTLSDFEDFDDGMDSLTDESDTEIDKDGSPSTAMKTLERSRRRKMCYAHRIASELLTTERNYVRKLHLVSQVFHYEVTCKNREFHMFSGEVIPQMFSNIKSIYQFHTDFLLPQLESRMAEWDENPRIGDVMKKFAPFLKLYTEYVKNYENGINIINLWMDKSSKFQKIIENIQKLPECGSLALQYHMLEPVQRVPRYLLLLKDYQRHLPGDSVDAKDTADALNIVAEAARHSNEVMRKIEKFRKLIDLSESLGTTVDLVSQDRDLIKEGKMTRISARDGSHIDRYLFLFSDLLLVCQTLPLNIGQKQQYRIKLRMDFDGMEIVQEAHNLETPNTFYVKGKQKSIELHVPSVKEKNEWIMALRSVISECRQTNQKDVGLNSNLCPNKEIGKRAPTWIKDQETSMCMCCSVPFSAFRRRHHCRACGHVICGKCSSRRAQLPYKENREKRVCDPCFQALDAVAERRQHTLSESDGSTLGETQRRRAPGFLKVKASDPSVICGYLNMSCNQKNWNRRFFAVHEDFVLYSFKAHQDVVAMTSLPLPGYQVLCLEGDNRGLQVLHPGQTKIYYLQTEDEATRNRWVEVLQQVVQLKLPAEGCVALT